MAEVVKGYDCVVAVVEVGWHWVDAIQGPTMALASAPIGKDVNGVL
jgi:hypothetical protein